MQLVRTAYSIIDQDGFENFSARKLAEVLGVSHMTVYNYMDRDEILGAVIVMGFAALEERFSLYAPPSARREDGSCAVFTHIATELFDFAKAHPNIYRFMFQDSGGFVRDQPRIRELYSSSIGLIRESIAPERLNEIRGDAYLFFVLVNGLILGNLNKRHSVTDEECSSNIARAYELILGRHCAGTIL